MFYGTWDRCRIFGEITNNLAMPPNPNVVYYLTTWNYWSLEVKILA